MNGVQVGGRLEAHRGPSHHVLAGQPLPEGTEKWVASHVDSIDMHGGKAMSKYYKILYNKRLQVRNAASPP